MEVVVKPFQMEYWSEVKELVKKLFDYPEDYDYEKNYLYMYSYKWVDDISIEEYPYKYGAVIIDDGKIVGFLGAYYAKRRLYNSDGKEFEYVTTMNCTRYAIEKEYRMQVFPILKKLMDKVDVITDCSANEAMYNIFTKVFKFVEYSSNDIRFFPVPFDINEDRVVCEELNIESACDAHRIIMLDHAKYGVRLCSFVEGTKIGYLFWEKKYSEKYQSYYVRIHRVENKDFFSKNAWQIIWFIQKECFDTCKEIKDYGKELFNRINNNQLFLAECDESYVNESELRHPLYFKHPFHRLVLDKRVNDKRKLNLDLLYSEYVVKNENAIVENKNYG